MSLAKVIAVVLHLSPFVLIGVGGEMMVSGLGVLAAGVALVYDANQGARR